METKQIIEQGQEENIEERARKAREIIEEIHNSPETMKKIREFIEETS